LALPKLALFVAGSCLWPFALEAATVPVGFADQRIATGLTSPSAMAVTPDGRVLVTQQNGEVRIIKNDVLLPTPFYTVDADFTFERGLLGVVTDPGFATNHWVYLYFTARTPAPHNRILRVTEANDTVVSGSEQVILDLPNVPSGTKWHMGGALRFGTDGKLYVAVGNHEDDPQPVASSNSQKLTNPFGKILRINPDGTVPSDNPFFNTTGAYRAIWSYGFRNPFTFAIQPGTGIMFVNDVGQGSWEEVNRGQRGGNYGWPAVEGSGSDTRYLNPAHAYSHSDGCAVTGGAFYNPTSPQFPASYVGKFLFADFCRGWIRLLDPANNAVTPFVTGISFPVNLEVAANGSLYYLARNQATGTPNPGGGTVSKITFTGSQAPRITLHPESQTIFLGDPVTFTVAADGATGFQWQRNGQDIAGATSPTYTIATTMLSDDGARFRALARNAAGSAASSEATLTITTNHFPRGTILTPAAGSSYADGEDIVFSGSGTDQEDGSLPPSAFTWQVDFQHDTHQHPFMPPTSGISSGSFTSTAPGGHDLANVWYRLYLTVRDSGGQTHSSARDVRPRTHVSDMSFSGTPANGWGPVERDMSNGETAAGDGHTITLDAIPYAKGLGVHAPSDVRYALGGTCSGKFIADVGVDDEVGSGGSVVFQVWLDAVKAFDSGVVTQGSARQVVNVGVAGTNQLRLVVTDGGDGMARDHADWAGARVTGCGAAPACPTASAGGPWQNTAFTAQTGTFTAEFDVTPSASPVNGMVGLSPAAGTTWTAFATIVRFNETGHLDARNGGAYQAASVVPYSPNTSYHFRMEVNVPAHTYSVWVRPEGGTEQALGLNYAFRSEQASATSLRNWAAGLNTTPAGSLSVCGFTVTPGGGGSKIASINVRDAANAANWSIRSNLRAGDTSYGDRTYTFASVPAALAGAAWVRTANSSKAYTGTPLVTVTLSVAADVYLSIDDRVARPSWLASWVDTGTDLVVRESATVTRTLSVYRRSFPAGPVDLPPLPSSFLMYSVVVP
jgi:glucose/arabinose dehydrogenase